MYGIPLIGLVRSQHKHPNPIKNYTQIENLSRDTICGVAESFQKVGERQFSVGSLAKEWISFYEFWMMMSGF